MKVLRNKLRIRLEIFKNWILRKKLDISVIPEGQYCHEDKTCSYWRFVGRGSFQAGCIYLKWIDKGEGLLWDQCKECGINWD